MENIVGMEYKTTDNNITGKTNLEAETKKEKHYEEVMTHFYIELLKLSNWINTQTTSYKQKYFHSKSERTYGNRAGTLRYREYRRIKPRQHSGYRRGVCRFRR